MMDMNKKNDKKTPLPTKYFVDSEGNYIGAFSGTIPENGIEVKFPPENAFQKWDGKKWLPYENAYAAKRAAEYPDIGDQLDAIMKWVAGENEITVTPELKSIAMQCMAVKSKYPKGGKK